MFGDQIDTIDNIEVANCEDSLEDGIVIIRDEGVFFEGAFTDGIGLDWDALLRVIRHPFVRERLDEADMR